MSLELTGVHGLLKRHKLFTHKYYKKEDPYYSDFSFLPVILFYLYKNQ